MFSPDLTLKSCILWIFSLFFPPPHLSFLSLHFHCEFIRVCSSLVELFLLALCTHHTPNIQQQQQHSKPELQEKSQILSNSQKFSMLKLSCSCSTFYAYFFCSFFRHYHEPLEIRNLFIFHPNEQFWDFFLCFSHTRPPPLCVDYAWNFPIFILKSSALKGGSISCCGERKKIHFVVTRWMCRVVHVYRHLQHCSSPYEVECGGWEGSWMTWSNNDFSYMSFSRPPLEQQWKPSKWNDIRWSQSQFTGNFNFLLQSSSTFTIGGSGVVVVSSECQIISTRREQPWLTPINPISVVSESEKNYKLN